MKIKAISLVALMLCTFFAMAQEGANGAKLVVENPSHDFGEIDKGEKVTTVFKFKNAGDAPLEIQKVATSCGCTSAAPEKTSYEPGESGEISVTFDSERFSGPITKRVTIHTNDANSPKTVVTIAGTVVVDITATPTSLFFAKAKMGQASTEEIKVSTTKLDKLEISEIQVSPEFLSAKVEKIDDKNAKIIVTADGSKFPEGKTRLNGSLTYKTNSKSQETMKTIIAVNIERPIRVSPNSVYFFASKQGKKRESFLKLISTEKQEFTLSDIKSDLEYITVEVKEDNGANKSLVVSLAENAPEGKFQGKITIATNLPAQKELVIPIRGSVVK